MNNKRSYLDTLNQGRQRRSGTTLEQITQSLQNLESRLDRSRDDDFAPPRQSVAPAAAPQRDVFAPLPNDYREPARRVATPRTPYREATRDVPFQSLASDFDRVRSQEDGIASVSRIAGELKGLREDLRQQMTANIQTEFATLRDELGRTLASNVPAAAGAELANEIERISRGMRDLANRADDKSVNLLRGEIEQVRTALGSLAREDTVRSSDRRWEQLDQRWTEFENRVDARQGARDPEFSALSARLSTISDAVNNLPESLSLRSLEEKIRTLAGAIDHFVRQQEHQAPETYRLIEERLDEISRAIVASTAAASASHLDMEPFERIEARISSLARQIEEVVEDRPTAEIIDRLGVLSQRVDDLTARGHVPEQAMERLGKQILGIAKKIDQTPLPLDADRLFTGIEERFEALSAMIERRQGDAIEQGNMMFRDLERRLDEVADRIDMRSAENIDQATVMRTIDSRFTQLADQLVGNTSSEFANEAIRGLESRLEKISARIDASAKQFAGIDPQLIRSLQGQVSALTEHLSRPAAPLPELEDIGPRLEEIERSIAGSRDTILDAARQAAENAVRSFNGSQTHTAAVTELSHDLKALESLTRHSDERNSKTFEAIHDTLIKIVDRLAGLDVAEQNESHPAPMPAPAKRTIMEINPTPPLQMDPADRDALPVRDPTAKPSAPASAGARTPAEAAADAALAASTSEIVATETVQRPKSLLGGLARALGKKDQLEKAAPQERVQPTISEPVASAIDTAALDLKVMNRPLEPGSGAPDLDAIMKRVRDERGNSTPTGEPDAAKSDFIAAARRAAQAAAAETELLKRNAAGSGTGRGGKVADAVKAKRKPILMAATGILVVLACAQLGRSFFGGDPVIAPETAKLETGLTVDEAIAASASAPASETNDATMATETDPTSSLVASAAPTADPAPMATAIAPGKDTGVPATETVPAASATPTDAPSSAQVAAVDPAPMLVPAVDAAAPSAPAQPTATAPAIEKVPVEGGPVVLREAAEAGDAKALFEVGSRFAEGRGTKADMKQAAKWYEKSAELGFAPAQYRVGNFYEKALGVERDLGKAKTWYQLASEQGNAAAMHNLAVLYATGADGVADNESANRWFMKAANLGVKDSQFNLGILAAKGVGMPQSLEESYKWFALVAKSGDRDAATKRDEIANALRPEQLQKARAAVELWKAQTPDPEANSVEIPDSWQEASGTTASIDMKKAVSNIQRILNKNGYDAGGSDGVMGLKTKNAIMAFQKDNKMEQTGQVDEKLVKALLARK